MGKLLRSARAENMRLYSGVAALLAIIAVFLIALGTSWVIGANSGEKSLLPKAIVDKINESPVKLSTEQVIENENDIQTVIPNDVISGSNITSGTDISRTDAVLTANTAASETARETVPFESWQDACRARYEELTELNNEYLRMAESMSGKEKAYYITKQQEAVREAYIINACLRENKEPGFSKAWNVIYFTIWLMMLPIGVFVSAVTASKTAGEYRSGVIYTLYTLPVTRLKQYFAKLMSVSAFAVVLCAAAWTGSVFGGMLGCGGLEYKGEYVRVLGESAVSESFFTFSLEIAACVLVTSFIITAFSAAVSIMTRSIGAATALTAVLCIASMLLGKTAGASGNVFIGLSIVSCLDISAPVRGVPNYAQAGYIVSYLAAAIHWLVFIIMGYIGVRRDVR